MKLNLGLRTRAWWDDLQSSLWFRPFIITALSIALALSNTLIEQNLKIPPILNTSADNARAILTAIASSMLTVTSVTFSIVMLALVLASQQFSPRVLRNFMGDKATQNVLGIFIGAFMYSMVVMGSISDRDETTFIPVISTLIALGFALVSVSVFIYFINHIAKKIHANDIIASIAEDIESLLHNTFQADFIKNQYKYESQEVTLDAGTAVLAPVSGYVQGLDLPHLAGLAEECETVFQLRCDVGHFVVVDSPLLTVHPAMAITPSMARRIYRDFDIGQERTLFADILFGIRQLEDIALKAISPAVNDPTTAINCLDYLCSLLMQANRYPALPTHYYDEKGQLRLIAPRMTFGDMLNLSFDQIRQYATTDVTVTLRLLDVLISLAVDNNFVERQSLLLSQAKSIRTGASHRVPVEADREAINARLTRLNELLDEFPNLALLPHEQM